MKRERTQIHVELPAETKQTFLNLLEKHNTNMALFMRGAVTKFIKAPKKTMDFIRE